MSQLQKMSKKNLYSISDAKNLSIEDVHRLYNKHVNASRVELLSVFDFGRELVSHSEWMYIYTKDGKKIFLERKLQAFSFILMCIRPLYLL